jgi:predicted amidohydrolase YtcJ
VAALVELADMPPEQAHAEAARKLTKMAPNAKPEDRAATVEHLAAIPAQDGERYRKARLIACMKQLQASHEELARKRLPFVPLLQGGMLGLALALALGLLAGALLAGGSRLAGTSPAGGGLKPDVPRYEKPEYFKVK